MFVFIKGETLALKFLAFKVHILRPGWLFYLLTSYDSPETALTALTINDKGGVGDNFVGFHIFLFLNKAFKIFCDQQVFAQNNKQFCSFPPPSTSK